ncbi:glycosyltransferase family 2 protein [bacterium]|nr:glycosyltransferase family 2 protein [bacterium]
MTIDTQIFVSVRNRAAVTRATIREILIHGGGRAELHIFDDRSDREFDPLLELYRELRMRAGIAAIHLQRSVPEGVAWGKSYALAAFLATIAHTLPAERRRFVAMIDNDVELRPGWLDECIAFLKLPEAKARRITVACPWIDPHYTRFEELRAFGRRLAVQREHGAAAWVFAWDFVERHGLPDIHDPVGPGHEEAYYVRSMRRNGECFGSLADLADPYARGRVSERELQESLPARGARAV